MGELSDEQVKEAQRIIVKQMRDEIAEKREAKRQRTEEELLTPKELDLVRRLRRIFGA